MGARAEAPGGGDPRLAEKSGEPRRRNFSEGDLIVVTHHPVLSGLVGRRGTIEPDEEGFSSPGNFWVAVEGRRGVVYRLSEDWMEPAEEAEVG